MPHTLAVVDVLVAAERLTDEVPTIGLQQLLLERELRRRGLRVTVPTLSRYDRPVGVAVVPDAVFSLGIEGTTQYLLLELDRGTERQRAWREKVAALTLWLASAQSTQLLTTEYVTVMVVTTAGKARRDYLRSWTLAELQARGLYDEYASMFAFTEASPADTEPVEFFGGNHWYPPYKDVPDSLVNLPERQPTS
jgi:hypothetical protein